jgi:hypothetical protein
MILTSLKTAFGDSQSNLQLCWRLLALQQYRRKAETDVVHAPKRQRFGCVIRQRSRADWLEFLARKSKRPTRSMVFGPHLSGAQPPEMSAAAMPIKMGASVANVAGNFKMADA